MDINMEHHVKDGLLSQTITNSEKYLNNIFQKIHHNVPTGHCPVARPYY